MIVRESELYLYHLTLKRQSNYVHSCIGHFVDDRDDGHVKDARSSRRVKDLQLCIATETHIELFDVSEGNLRKLAEVALFATLTGMKSLRAENSRNSVLVITSDSGNLTVCKFERRAREGDGANVFGLRTLVNEPLARSGIRRLSPISGIQVDLFGRCLFLSAVEKNKLCFVLNSMSGDETLRVQSPLEVNRPHMLTLDTTACDVQYDNPCFASLEIDTSANNETHLIFYILDLGLNHVVKKADYKIDAAANFVMGLPSLSKYGISCTKSTEGDSIYEGDEVNPFVLIAFENYILIKDMNGYYNLKVQIPRRKNQGTQGTSIISFALQTLKNDFFVLLQSNLGDLFKFKIFPNQSANNTPAVSISYFDTVPQAEGLHIFKNGFLFANTEYGDSYLFQFESLGEDEENGEGFATSAEPEKKSFFENSESLRNLSVAQRIKIVNPLTAGKVIETSPLKIIAATNDTPTSLTNGVNFQEKISSNLPPGAQNIWTICLPEETYHKLLFIGFSKSTMILKIEEGTIEELALTSNPFRLKSDRTLFANSIGQRSIIQVCENEVRQIIPSDDKKDFVCKLEWLPPAGIRVVAATCTQNQLAVGLSNGEIVYFEMDAQSGEDTLHELQNRIEVDEVITSMSMLFDLRSDFLAVGSQESTIRIFSLKSSDQDNFLEVVAIQTMPSPVHDLKLVRNKREIELHVGLQNGLYSCSKLNVLDGQIYDERTRFLGPKPVSISFLKSMGLNLTSADEDEDDEEEDDEAPKEEEQKNIGPCVLLHCSKTWVSYTMEPFKYIRPAITSSIDSNFTNVAEFRAQNINSNGICALNSSGALIIGVLNDFVSIEKWFNGSELNRIAGGNMHTAQYGKDKDGGEDIDENENEDGDEDEDEEYDSTVKERLYKTQSILEIDGSKKILMYVQNSLTENLIRIGVSENEKFYTVENSENNYKNIQGLKATTASIAKFVGNGKYLVVASTDRKLFTYEVVLFNRGKETPPSFDLKPLHITPIEDSVHTMISFLDTLLVPIFGKIVLYGFGKKQLLKKSISSTTPSITKITAVANWNNERIAIGDNRESVTLFLFDKGEKAFRAVADDTVKRHVTTLEFLDQSTVIGGDKFGNIWTLRLDEEYERRIEINFPHALDRLQELPALKDKAPNIMECPFKLKLMNHFYVNDIPVKIQIFESIQMSDRPGIIYLGLQGTIGCLIPLLSKSEIGHFKKIEHMMSDADDKFFLEQENQHSPTNTTDNGDGIIFEKAHTNKQVMPEGSYSIVGRDHSKYRGYYVPLRNIIDGDLCENFLSLTHREQTFLCKDVHGLKLANVTKRINEIRSNCI